MVKGREQKLWIAYLVSIKPMAAGKRESEPEGINLWASIIILDSRCDHEVVKAW